VVILAGLAGFAGAALTVAICGMPTPQIHDEFSYLLAAKTYALGRLTNPPHPMGPWLETFHTLSRPTYMSRYPPAPGAFLALGILAHLPILGVWLSTALACAAVAWMLLCWLSPRWVLGGAVLLAFHPTMLGWAHSFWGGSVAVLGGAMTVGAARRLIDRANVADSLLLGAGVVILAMSRPWEGAVFVAALVIVALSMRLLRMRPLVPAMIVVAAGALFTLYDNWRVTGRPLLMPYALYERQYNFTPPLIVLPTHPVTLRSAQMRQITMSWAYDQYAEKRTPLGFLAAIPKTLAIMVNGAFAFVPDAQLVREPDPLAGMALSLLAIVQELLVLAPLFLLPILIRRDRLLRGLTIVLAAVFFVALLPAVAPLPHYAAPAVGVFVLLWMVCVRELVARGWRARTVISGVAAAWLFGCIFFFHENRRWPYRWDEVRERLEIERDFNARPGRHVLLVRYDTHHNPHFEWVQNGPDIDGQTIVWAHDLGDNAPLLRYYRDRDAWLVTAGYGPAGVRKIGP